MQDILIQVDNQAIQRLDRIFKLQKEAFLKNPYPTAAERIENIKKVEPMLRKYRHQILDALNEDFGGHSKEMGDLVEILGMFERAKYNISKVKSWMRPVSKAVHPITMGNSKAYVKYQPKGVVGNMVSWNFPFDIAIGPMLDALAAGNRMIIKPSDAAPACGKVLQEMIEDTFSEDLVSVVNGELELAKYFATLKWDHLLYTGSGNVGKKIMQAASENLVPVTLELGGKCPVILDSNAITDENIAEIAGVKVVKRGQMCVTADYCLVPESKLEDFVSKLENYFRNNFSENNAAAHSCGIITQRHLNRLGGLVQEAKDKGTRVIQIGDAVSGDNRHMSFYLVVNPSDDLGMIKEEIFGPILPIKSYQTTQDILDYVNKGDRPLGLYIYSKDKKFIDTITTNTHSGGVAINAIALQAAVPSLPFGGIGPSGMGVHHGEEAFKEFSNPRGYFVKGKGGTFDLITAPYNQKSRDFIENVGYASLGKQALFAIKRLPRMVFERIFS